MLDMHEKLAKDLSYTKLRYNYLLRGQYHRSKITQLLKDEKIMRTNFKNRILEEADQAIKWFDQSLEIKPDSSDTLPWIDPLNSKMYFYELLYSQYGEKKYLNEKNKIRKKLAAKLESFIITDSIPFNIAQKFLYSRYNLAEGYLCECNLNSARSNIIKGLEWFNEKKGCHWKCRAPEEQYLYKALKGLEIMCDLIELNSMDMPGNWGSSQDTIVAMAKKKELESDLANHTYCGEMISIMLHIVESQHQYSIYQNNKNNSTTKSESLAACRSYVDIARNYIKSRELDWKTQNVSRPLAVLTILKEAVFDSTREASFPLVRNHCFNTL